MSLGTVQVKGDLEFVVTLKTFMRNLCEVSKVEQALHIELSPIKSYLSFISFDFMMQSAAQQQAQRSHI